MISGRRDLLKSVGLLGLSDRRRRRGPPRRHRKSEISMRNSACVRSSIFGEPIRHWCFQRVAGAA